VVDHCVNGCARLRKKLCVIAQRSASICRLGKWLWDSRSGILRLPSTEFFFFIPSAIIGLENLLL
jgi:hypothetical protein